MNQGYENFLTEQCKQTCYFVLWDICKHKLSIKNAENLTDFSKGT